MKIFRITRLEADTCGNTWQEKPSIYVQATNKDSLKYYLNKIPKGFYRFQIDEILLALPSSVPAMLS